MTTIQYNAEIPYDSVVIGLTPSLFTYDHFNTAFRILVGEHETQLSSSSKLVIPLIAVHKAKYIESVGGALSLGPGQFVRALEDHTGLHAEVVGKPSRSFFQTVIDNFQATEFECGTNGGAGRIAVIGDDVEADLGEGAVELGLWRILGEARFFFFVHRRLPCVLMSKAVKTGKYRPGDEHRPGLKPPDEVFESFAAFVDSYLRHAIDIR